MSYELTCDHFEANVSIPTFPSVVQRITTLLDDPDAGLAEIGGEIAQDPGLAAKVLRIANGSYYGQREEVLSTERAASVLGGRVLRNVALQAAIIRQYDHLRDGSALDVEALWRHCILSAQVCQSLGESVTAEIELAPEELYTCGLLHDLGKIVLLDSLGEVFLEAVRLARSRSLEQHRAELETLGFSHPDVGALVANRWGLPGALARAIHLHHAPPDELRASALLSLVDFADRLCHAIENNDKPAAMRLIESEVLEFLGLERSRLGEVAASAVRSWNEIEV